MSSRKKSIALFCTSIFISFLLAEVLVRLVSVQETKRLAMYDKDLGWRGRPQGRGVYVRKQDNINVPFQYNELGFRDKEIRKQETVSARILFLGDSFVENLEVPFERTFPHLVERRLQERIDSSLDVVAVSSQGYSTAQEILALRKFGDLLKPDIVLLAFFTGNDFEDNARKNFAYLDDQGWLAFPPNTDTWLQVQSASFQRWLYESSALVFYVKNVLLSQSALKIEDASKASHDASKEYRFAITKELILAAKTEAGCQNARFGLLLFTSRYQMLENDLEKTEFVARVCRESGIPLLDSRGIIAPDDFFEHDIHFSERGHMKMTEAIVDFLSSEFDDQISSFRRGLRH